MLAHSLGFLPRGTVEIHEFVFTLETRLTGIIAFVIVSTNAPRDKEDVGDIGDFWRCDGNDDHESVCGGKTRSLPFC